MEEEIEARSGSEEGRDVAAREGTGGTERGTIVIVGRNNLHLTKRAVASALKQDMPCDVILVDNASSDGTAQWALTKRLAHVAFMEQKSLAFCWNFALKIIFKRQGHALVLNNDVEILPETYGYLLGYSTHQRVPFVTCVSVNTQEQLDAADPLHWSYHVRPHPDFSCFLIRKECFDLVGPFDEEMWPAYCEDTDYHVRMHRRGIKAVCIDLPFLHHGAGTIRNADPVEKAIIQRGADANRQRFKQKYGCLPGTPEYQMLFQMGGRHA